jgi:fluoride exporter
VKQTILVGAGGFIGSVLRYTLGGMIFHRFPDWKLPAGTIAVNVSGCLAAGLLAGLADKRGLFAGDVRLFVFVGILGGYTTFSAFSLETITLVQRNQLGIAAINVLASVGLGLLALWVGMRAV